MNHCNTLWRWFDVHCTEGFVLVIVLILLFSFALGIKIGCNIRAGKNPTDILS